MQFNCELSMSYSHQSDVPSVSFVALDSSKIILRLIGNPKYENVELHTDGCVSDAYHQVLVLCSDSIDFGQVAIEVTADGTMVYQWRHCLRRYSARCTVLCVFRFRCFTDVVAFIC